jgi:hypothetical protein
VTPPQPLTARTESPARWCAKRLARATHVIQPLDFVARLATLVDAKPRSYRALEAIREAEEAYLTRGATIDQLRKVPSVFTVDPAAELTLALQCKLGCRVRQVLGATDGQHHGYWKRNCGMILAWPDVRMQPALRTGRITALFDEIVVTWSSSRERCSAG